MFALESKGLEKIVMFLTFELHREGNKLEKKILLPLFDFLYPQSKEMGVWTGTWDDASDGCGNLLEEPDTLIHSDVIGVKDLICLPQA